MTDVRGLSETPDPRHIFLTAKEVIERYGWGRTKGYQVLRRSDFPRPVAGDRYRLDTVMAWEDRQLEEQQRLAEHNSAPFPMRKRHRGGAGAVG
jgi:predicted DNA-binding transcriptional regulator AlpA